jgi:hypothetical protein
MPASSARLLNPMFSQPQETTGIRREAQTASAGTAQDPVMSATA